MVGRNYSPSAQLDAWLVAFIWPFTRRLSYRRSTPRPTRIPTGQRRPRGFTACGPPSLPVLPQIDPASWAGLFCWRPACYRSRRLGFSMLLFTAVNVRRLMVLQMAWASAVYESHPPPVRCGRFFGLAAGSTFLRSAGTGALRGAPESLRRAHRRRRSAGVFWKTLGPRRPTWCSPRFARLPLIAALLTTPLAGVLSARRRSQYIRCRLPVTSLSGSPRRFSISTRPVSSTR